MNWEYQIIECADRMQAKIILNQEGEDRWELVTYLDDREDGYGCITLVLKRQKH